MDLTTNKLHLYCILRLCCYNKATQTSYRTKPMSKSQKTYLDIPLQNYNINEFSSAVGISYNEKGSDEKKSVVIDKGSVEETKIAICALLDALVMIDEDMAQIKAALKEDVITERGEESFKFNRIERCENSVKFSITINKEEFEYSFASSDNEDCDLIFYLESTLNSKLYPKSRLIDDLENHNKDLSHDYYSKKMNTYVETLFAIIIITFLCVIALEALPIGEHWDLFIY